jgi:hypothetical protein
MFREIKTILAIFTAICFIFTFNKVHSSWFIEINNTFPYNLIDYQTRIEIPDYIGYNFIIRDQNGNNVNYCFEQANGECNQTPTNVIWVKVPFIPANGEAKLYIYQSDTNNAVNGDQVFDFYDDFNGNSLNISLYHNNSPNIFWKSVSNGTAVLSNNGYAHEYVMFINKKFCINNRGTNYIFEFRQFNNPGNNKYIGPIVYSFNNSVGEGITGLDSGNDIHSYNVKWDSATDSWVYISYKEPNYPAIIQAWYDLLNKYLVLRNANGSNYYQRNAYYTITEDHCITFGYNERYSCDVYFDWWRVRKIVSSGDPSSFLPYSIYPAYKIIFNVNNSLSCYYEDSSSNLLKTQCELVPSTYRWVIYDNISDLKLEIINPKLKDNVETITITLQKLDESIGYVKIKAAIENLSFDKAIVYVPITLDANRQVIKTTKNGQPYIVPKYYLVYEFNETDPVFESYIGPLGQLVPKKIELCKDNVCNYYYEGSNNQYYLNFTEQVFKLFNDTLNFTFYNIVPDEQINLTILNSSILVKTNYTNGVKINLSLDPSYNYNFTLNGLTINPYSINGKVLTFVFKLNPYRLYNFSWVNISKKIPVSIVGENYQSILANSTHVYQVINKISCLNIRHIFTGDIFEVCGDTINKVAFIPISTQPTKVIYNASVLDGNFTIAKLYIKKRGNIKEVYKFDQKLEEFPKRTIPPYYKTEGDYLVVVFNESDPIITATFATSLAENNITMSLFNAIVTLFIFIAMVLIIK